MIKRQIYANKLFKLLEMLELLVLKLCFEFLIFEIWVCLEIKIWRILTIYYQRISAFTL